MTAEIELSVGDYSGSRSERHVMNFGAINHQALEFGEMSTATYTFQPGSYPVSVRHVDSTLPMPDYDYTETIKVDNSGWSRHIDQ